MDTSDYLNGVATGVLLLTVMMVFIGRWFSLLFYRPIERMRKQALRIANGDFDQMIVLGRGASKEHQGLAQAINSIAIELKQRLAVIDQQSRQQKVIISSMVEGLIAVDQQGQILTINNSALEMLELKSIKLNDTIIYQILRNQKLSQIIHTALEKSEPLGEEVLLDLDETRYLYVQSSPIYDAEHQRSGTVLVIADMTQMKELERHRKDFVANVSHEMRTPLTSIQGFAETLMNPEFNDPELQKEFVGIISNHATRLNLILEDLLALAKIERDTDLGAVKLQLLPLAPVFNTLEGLFSHKAKKKNITLQWDLLDDVHGKINEPLLVSAVGNLIDNGIKYSPESTEIYISMTEREGQILIEVRDQGQGISAADLPRLFERFYRVDRGRSRQDGGTGLGLAIVKHIALAHRGEVEVESDQQEGSLFRIVLPT